MVGWRGAVRIWVRAGLVAAAIGLLPLAAEAAGTPALVPLCASCHGAQGISASPTIPNLAGQKQGYLESALSAYKAGQRQGQSAAMMNGIATHLSDADIAALSAYFASLKGN
jgi:cytochrome c553